MLSKKKILVIGVFVLLTASFGLFFLRHHPVQAVMPSVTISIEPQASQVTLDSLFLVDISVGAGADGVDAVQAYLNFDPDYLQVAEIIPDLSGLEILIKKTVDNETGQIDYAAVTLDPEVPTGTFNIASIRFKAIAPGTTIVSFNLAVPRSTKATLSGADRIVSTTDGEVTISLPPTPTPTATPTPTSTPGPSPTPTPTPLSPCHKLCNERGCSKGGVCADYCIPDLQVDIGPDGCKRPGEKCCCWLPCPTLTPTPTPTVISTPTPPSTCDPSTPEGRIYFDVGDANCDGVTDDLDYVLWWKAFEVDAGGDFYPAGGDGVTNEDDYGVWLANYGL